MAIFAAGVLSVTSMGGIVTAHAEETLSVPAEEAGAGAVQMDGKDAQAAEDGSVAASEGLIAGSFKPSEIAQPAQDTYEYPFLGMKLGISKDLKEQMEKKNISMFTDERWNDNADAVTYATASWCTLTDEQKDAEVDKMGTGYDDWLKSLSRVGVIGMYDEESQKDLDRITGCTEHKELGTSSDGKYKYYLSTNKDADADLLKDVEGIEVTLTEMTPFQMLSAFDQPQDTSDSTEATEGTNVGKFETTGVDGKTEKIQLQTPEKEKSFQQGQCPYGIFHIECSKTGYACACFKNVQIFPGVNSYLRVDMKKDDKGSKDEIIFPHHHLFVEDNNA